MAKARKAAKKKRKPKKAKPKASRKAPKGKAKKKATARPRKKTPSAKPRVRKAKPEPRPQPKPAPTPAAPVGTVSADTVSINRAPVLTLWGAVVAERLGFDRDAALTLGKAVAGLNAQSKGRRLGIFGTPKAPERGGPPKRVGLGEEFWVEICGRPVPGKYTADGIRAVILDKPIDPDGVRRYLAGKFGGALDAVREAMRELADSFEPERLELLAYSFYEQFRPQIEPGRRGWGQKGTLDLALIRSLGGEG
ncbi:MAG: hypothetical protein ACYS9X_08450 [Planctomycetota bacterium]